MHVYFPAVILPRYMLWRFENFLLHFLAHTFSGKVTNAFVTILSGFEQQGKNLFGVNLPQT